MSIRRLFNHVVWVHREPDALLARDDVGGVELAPVPTGPRPTAYNARPNQSWVGTLSDRGPGEEQVGRRLWFLDANLDVMERDVLAVVDGPEAGLLVRVLSVVPVSTRRRVHHLQANTEVWVGELELTS